MRLALTALVGALAASRVAAYRVAISDKDDFHEVCSGMYGGEDAYIEVAFDQTSSGQISLVVYEWGDVEYLGVETAHKEGETRPKTYICTTDAARTGLCTSAQLGQFITSLPEGRELNSTSIYTAALRFGGSGGEPTPTTGDDDEDNEERARSAVRNAARRRSRERLVQGLRAGAPLPSIKTSDPEEDEDEDEYAGIKEPVDDIDFYGAGMSMPGNPAATEAVASGSAPSNQQSGSKPHLQNPGAEVPGDVPQYSKPVRRSVPKTGYYCVGIVPITLVTSRSEIPGLEERASSVHAEYTGVVNFRNEFEGELPAVEYPKIKFYGFMSIVYVVLAIGWGVLCAKHFRELLPMQYYISGTIGFLVIEMIALWTYYRYINKHGGGAASLAFLIVVAILNAARNSLSFFLLLIVAMGLSVVTQSLGNVMTRVRILTAFHFVFGVAYAVGTVKIQIDNASIFTVLFLIFPLAISLTAFLMWIIVSLNGTILHLQERKQNYKLQMFQRLWRILIISVIAVSVFFVLSSISLSNRLDEDYAPRNWRWRWILLDASLAVIYLSAFTAIAWLWRPTENNVRFAMSTELAQDDADAEDYEIHELDHDDHDHDHDHTHTLGLSGLERTSREHIHGDDPDDPDNERKRLFPSGSSAPGTRHALHDDNVVFAMGDDSDSDDEGQPLNRPQRESFSPTGSTPPRGLDTSRRSSGLSSGFHDLEDVPLRKSKDE